MDKTFVYSYLENHRNDYFPNDKYSEEKIEKLMLSSSDVAANYLNGLKLASPTLTVVISFFLGQLGIDRFYIGDIKNGVLKLITSGGFGVWWLIDVIKMKKICCEKNCEKLIGLLERYPAELNGGYTIDDYVNDFKDDDISDILDDGFQNINRPVMTMEEAENCLSSILEDDFTNGQ